MTKKTSPKDFAKSLSEEQKKKFVKMVWNDDTTYKMIDKEFHVSPNQVEKIVRILMSDKEFIRWRKRLERRTHKKGRDHHKLAEQRLNTERE